MTRADIGARKQCAQMIDEAVRQGVCDAHSAWHMTPRELMARIERLARRREDELRSLDTLAWLVGQYVAVALKAPGRYPAKPDRVRTRAQGDAAMQRMMRDLASEMGD